MINHQVTALEKTCVRCRSVKSSSCFYRARRNSDGLTSYCKTCYAGHARDWRSNDENRKKHIEAVLKSRKKNPRVRLAARLKREYGISIEVYDDMVAKNNGRCYICNGLPNGVATILSVDHDHKTGKVRGLLCLNCNTGLGSFKDAPALLNKAVEYLEGVKC